MAPLVRTGGSRHTGLAALPHRNIHSGIDFTELTILRIEKGTRFVPDYELSVIADYFHVTSDYLLGRTNKE